MGSIFRIMEELFVFFQDQSGCTVENGLEKSKDIRKRSN